MDYHFEDRSFQRAEYLIDPAAYRSRARTWEQRELTMAYRIIAGAEVFAGHAASGQGVLWWCSTTAFSAKAVQRLDALDEAVIRIQFSVAEMDDLGL